MMNYAIKTYMEETMNFSIIRTMSTNNYLLKCNEGYFLIDAGMGKGYDTFVKKFNRINVDVSKIKYVMLTHHHFDHTAFLKELIDNTKAKLILHKEEVEPLSKGKNKLGTYKEGIVLNSAVSIVTTLCKLSFPPFNVSDDDIILAGDNTTLLREIGIDGMILHTPGHTNGSLSVLLSDGTAFVGDTAMNFFFSNPDPFVFESINDVYRSWKKLSNNGAKILYPAHGNPMNMDKVLSAIK